MNDFSWPDPFDDNSREIIADLREFGWHVAIQDDPNEGPPFAYSLGLHLHFQHPEVIVLGLPIEVSRPLIQRIALAVKAGERFQHAHEAAGVLDDFDVFFRQVDLPQVADYLAAACWFYRRGEFPVLQCVWPDARGKYPWHPCFPLALKVRQPILSADAYWPFHEGRNRVAFTSRQVIEDGRPILRVVHDQDGDWQFLCGQENLDQDGRLIRLSTALRLDATLNELADLPDGWQATRESTAAAWARKSPLRG